jgi:hypothetical protein
MRNGCTGFLIASIVTASTVLAWPTPAQAKLVSFSVKGDSVEAIFLGTDPDPEKSCIQYFVTVNAGASVLRTSPPPDKQPAPRTVLDAVMTNICTGVPLIGIFPEEVAVAPKVAANLRSASLKATVRGFSYTDLQWYDFDIDLEWTAEGPAVRENTYESFRDPESGIIIRNHNEGVAVPARAVGTVIISGTDYVGNPVNANMTPDPSIDGEILRSDASSLIIEH